MGLGENSHSKEGSRVRGFGPKFWAGLGGAKGMDLIHSYVLEGIIKELRYRRGRASNQVWEVDSSAP